MKQQAFKNKKYTENYCSSFCFRVYISLVPFYTFSVGWNVCSAPTLSKNQARNKNSLITDIFEAILIKIINILGPTIMH